jgi:hypothetical protein
MAPSAAADPRLDKISTGQPGGLWRVLLNRRNVAGAVGGLLFGPGLQLGKAGAVVGFCLARWVYTKTEQYVPFTKRRHIVLLPSVAGECVVCHWWGRGWQWGAAYEARTHSHMCMDSSSHCVLCSTRPCMSGLLCTSVHACMLEQLCIRTPFPC